MDYEWDYEGDLPWGTRQRDSPLTLDPAKITRPVSPYDYELEKKLRHQAMLDRELAAVRAAEAQVRQELRELEKGLTPVVRDERRWGDQPEVDGTKSKHGRPWLSSPPSYGMVATSAAGGDDGPAGLSLEAGHGVRFDDNGRPGSLFQSGMVDSGNLFQTSAPETGLQPGLSRSGSPQAGMHSWRSQPATRSPSWYDVLDEYHHATSPAATGRKLRSPPGFGARSPVQSPLGAVAAKNQPWQPLQFSPSPGASRTSWAERERLIRAEKETRAAMDRLQQVLTGSHDVRRTTSRAEEVLQSPLAAQHYRQPSPPLAADAQMQDPWDFLLWKGGRRSVLPGQTAWEDARKGRLSKPAQQADGWDDEVASLTSGGVRNAHVNQAGSRVSHHQDHRQADDHHAKMVSIPPVAVREGFGAPLPGARSTPWQSTGYVDGPLVPEVLHAPLPGVSSAQGWSSERQRGARSTSGWSAVNRSEPVVPHAPVQPRLPTQAVRSMPEWSGPRSQGVYPTPAWYMDSGAAQAPLAVMAKPPALHPNGEPMSVGMLPPAEVRQLHGRREPEPLSQVLRPVPHVADSVAGSYLPRRPSSAFHSPVPASAAPYRPAPGVWPDLTPAGSQRRGGPEAYGSPGTVNRSGEGRRGSPKKAATYDGKTSFADYQVQFELVAELNHWSAHEMGLELATNLRGAAQAVLSDLEAGQRYCYNTLVRALMARFEPEDQAELYRSQLRNRFRKPKEDLNALSADVKRLVWKAYPRAGHETKEKLARDSFIDSLNDANMELAVHQGHSTTLEAAVRVALEYEAFCEGRKNRHSLRGTVRAQTLESAPSEAPKKAEDSQDSQKEKGKKGACFYCKKSGHWKRECPERKKKTPPTAKAPPKGKSEEDSSVSNQGN